MACTKMCLNGTSNIHLEAPGLECKESR